MKRRNSRSYVFTVCFGDYGVRERFELSVKALSQAHAYHEAEAALVRAYKSFSWTIYTIKKVA